MSFFVCLFVHGIIYIFHIFVSIIVALYPRYTTTNVNYNYSIKNKLLFISMFFITNKCEQRIFKLLRQRKGTAICTEKEYWIVWYWIIVYIRNTVCLVALNGVCLCMCVLALGNRSMLVQTNYATRSRQATCPSSDVFSMLTLHIASGTLPNRNHTKAIVLFLYYIFILLFFLPCPCFLGSLQPKDRKGKVY